MSEKQVRVRTSSRKPPRRTPRRQRSEFKELWPNLCWPRLRVLEQQEADGQLDLKLGITFERDAPRKFIREVLEEEFSLLLTQLLYQIEEDDLKILFHQLKKMGYQKPPVEVDPHSAEEILTFLRSRGVARGTLSKVREILHPTSETEEE